MLIANCFAIVVLYNMASTFDPQSHETTGYHIFLEPDNSLWDEVQSTINQLASVYNGPIFTPHVTLLARIPAESEETVLKKTKALAKAMSPFDIRLGEIISKHAYFQACFMKVENGDEILNYHKIAREIFGIVEQYEYVPHMSLFYGNISSADSSTLLKSINIPATKKFTVKKLALYHTPGTVSTWKKIFEVPLS